MTTAATTTFTVDSHFAGKDPVDKQQIVNVATVPMRSPFRYAGGKNLADPINTLLAAQTGRYG